MTDGEKLYIWQADDWPKWHYDLSALTGSLATVCLAQGRLREMTDWLSWFLGSLERALASSQTHLDSVLFKAPVWQAWVGQSPNERRGDSAPPKKEAKCAA